MEFSLTAREHADPHRYETVACGAAEGGDLVEDVATVVRSLYLDMETLSETLRSAADGLEPLVDTGFVAEVIARIAAAAIPEPAAGGGPPQLDVARNELAEVLTYEAMDRFYGFVVPARRVREKETPSQPSRGLDLLALDLSNGLRVVIVEVKASSDADSPPGVVGNADTGLKGQITNLVANREKILAELNWCQRHAEPAHHDALAQAMLMHVAGTLDLLLAPVLVRPADRCGPDDFGCFRSEPNAFDPHPVLMCRLVVESSLEELATAVYNRARNQN